MGQNERHEAIGRNLIDQAAAALGVPICRWTDGHRAHGDCPGVAFTPQSAGWSKASRGRARRSHPLGEVTYAGDGFTEYEDTAFGAGRVQIWDES